MALTPTMFGAGPYAGGYGGFDPFGGTMGGLEEFFQPFLNFPPTGTTGSVGGTTGAGAMAPGYTRQIPVDFIERENEYVLRCDIPGVHKDEIKLQADGQVLRFGHQAHPDREKKDEAEPGIFHRAERVSSFRGRALRMPDSADMDSISARYEDGVLHVHFKKKAATPKGEGRQIQVA